MATNGWTRAYQAVDPAFRSPLLRIPLHVTGPRSLKLIRAANALRSKTHPGVSTRRLSVHHEGIAGVLHEPAQRERPSPALVWIHGGGLISGTPQKDNATASTFAHDLDAVVLAVGYRLAPEHPYPAAIDDCFAALCWLVENAQSLGVDPTRIAVGGESAGGGLAAVLAQRALDAGIDLRLQVLVSPMLDDQTVLRAEEAQQTTIAWTVPSNRYGWTSYLDHEPGAADARPYTSAARREDLTGLPPAILSVGSVDPFHDETVSYAARLQSAQVQTELIEIPGAHHAAEILKPNHPRVVEVRRLRTQALRRALSLQ